MEILQFIFINAKTITLYDFLRLNSNYFLQHFCLLFSDIKYPTPHDTPDIPRL